ncbi:MAG TPA: hypothetical protein VMR86_00355 [Myxococcota bacterium]|nr:hypothetical protein [Myxococcota bacterium]
MEVLLRVVCATSLGLCYLELVALPAWAVELFILPGVTPDERRAALADLGRRALIVPAIFAVSAVTWVQFFAPPAATLAILEEVLLVQIPAGALLVGALWALFRWLRRSSLYPKSDNWFLTGAVMLAVALGATWVYVAKYPPITEAELDPISLEEADFTISSKQLVLRAGDREYYTFEDPWRPELSDQELNRALTSGALVTLWLYRDGNQIYGLEAGGIAIPKARCIHDYMLNRLSLLVLIAVFAGFGLWSVGRGFWFRRAAPDAEDDDEEPPEDDSESESAS